MAVGILRKKLPPNMATPLWLDYMDVIEEESENIKNKILEKKSLINYKLMDRDQLIDISKTLGVPIDLSVDSSIDFLIFLPSIKLVPLIYISFSSSMFMVVIKPVN